MAPLAPDEPLGAVSFIAKRTESLSGELERLEVVTLGLKNIDVPRALKGRKLPSALFTAPFPLRRDDVRAACEAAGCEDLIEAVVLRSDRTVYRQKTTPESFLL